MSLKTGDSIDFKVWLQKKKRKRKRSTKPLEIFIGFN